MAVAMGNIPILFDVISPRIVISDRKTRPSPVDAVLNLPKRDPHPHNPHHHHHIANTYYASLSVNSSSESSDKENRNHRVIARGKSNNSESNDVDFDFESSDEEENGSEEDENYNWENEMRKRMKEIEEMKELEKKAEELQNRMEADGEDEGRDETEEEKRTRVRKELEKVAKEQAERRATANLMFEVGQKAYGRGMYGRSIEFFEGALTIIPKPTLFGGEIQIWLAMAYEANNRHADCIALYQQLERKHPSVTIRRQASELRYILQAPKLKISQEEMVTIPLIGSSYDSYAGTWTDKYKDKDERSGSTTNQLPSSKDYIGDFMVWKPPVELEKNRAFWVAVTLWFGLVGTAVFLQR